MVFPDTQIDAIRQAEALDLEPSDIAFDPPTTWCRSSPSDLSDDAPRFRRRLSGQVLTIKNYYDLMKGKLTPVQIEGLRLLLSHSHAAVQQTEDRKVRQPKKAIKLELKGQEYFGQGPLRRVTPAAFLHGRPDA